MPVLQWVFWVVGALLQALVLTSLARGPFRQYPFLTVYTLFLFLATVVEAASLLDAGFLSPTTRSYFWIDDSIKRFLLFCIVFGFINRSLKDSPNRAMVRRWLILGALLVTAISFLIHHRLNVGFMMTNVGRDLSFYAAILNLVLWSLLIRSHARDRQLLAVTGGLGIQFTAEAIGHSLRHLSRSTVALGNITLVTGHLVCLYFWWQAFRQKAPGPAASPVRDAVRR
jgi:hypothetical protein